RSARYVRVTIPGVGTGTQRLTALSVHHRDLARGAPVEVSSTANDINLPAHLTDGSRSTRWESKTSDPQWAQVDLGETRDLGSVVLRWETAAAKVYRLEVSDDGVEWNTAARVTDGGGGVESVPLPEGTRGRFVRMHGEERLTKWAYSLFGL